MHRLIRIFTDRTSLIVGFIVRCRKSKVGLKKINIAQDHSRNCSDMKKQTDLDLHSLSFSMWICINTWSSKLTGWQWYLNPGPAEQRYALPLKTVQIQISWLQPTDLNLHCLSLSMWIYINILDQVIWLAENWKWACHLNSFSMTRVNLFSMTRIKTIYKTGRALSKDLYCLSSLDQIISVASEDMPFKDLYFELNCCYGSQSYHQEGIKNKTKQKITEGI